MWKAILSCMRPPARPLHILSSGKVHLTDPLTGFGGRDKLIEDLDEALIPESPSGALAVFDLAGWEDYRRVLGLRASDALIVRLAEAWVRALPASTRCYRSRQDEFCALIEAPANDAMAIFEDARLALQEEATSSVVSVSFGVALLPDEPNDPVDALIIADQHLRSRPSRERRIQDEYQRLAKR